MNNCIVNDIHHESKVSLVCSICQAKGYERFALDIKFIMGVHEGRPPANEVSWYEVAQFANWLNTNTGHQAAYKFTGTQGQGDYTFAVWEVGDAGYDSGNPYRNSNAYYFLPTEDEWVKAAYWNGTSLQTYSNASPDDLVRYLRGRGAGGVVKILRGVGVPFFLCVRFCCLDLVGYWRGPGCVRD